MPELLMEGGVIPLAYKKNNDAFMLTTIPNSKTVDQDGSDEKPKEFFKRKLKEMKVSLGSTKVLVHVLVCVFAIASWVDINGTWAELPLLVMKAKEGWLLPSYIIVLSQIANIGPIAFVLVSYFSPWMKPRLEKVTSFIIILISFTACFLLAFFWEESSVVGGTEHSTAFLTLTFFLALGDCTSSVSFYAFMAHLKKEYMASLFIGEGLSGMIPALIALGQGAGDITCVNVSSQVNETYPNGTDYNKTVYNVYPQYVEPNFSVQVFFLILSGVIAFSAVSFILLNFWGYCRSEMVDYSLDEVTRVVPDASKSSLSYGALDDCTDKHNMYSEDTKNQNTYLKDNGHIGPYDIDQQDEFHIKDEGHVGQYNEGRPEEEKTDPSFKSRPGSQTLSDATNTESSTTDKNNSIQTKVLETPQTIFMWKFFALLFLLIVINMTLTTFLPTIQIYSVLPYGLEYYHLTTTLTQIANPVACFFALFFMADHMFIILLASVLGEVGVGYIIYLAAQSPAPLMYNQSQGGQLAVAIWVALTLLLTYAKVCIATRLRKHGRSALIWAGVATQVGTLIGAIVGFVLTSEYHIFADAPYC
ncbi:riboflavin transporter 2-like [Physella acuta]|uniref:riboflavin transporter 2-like n=1 Tax=Physella acuta TaxID=109671 RepID=UPI0027DBAD56|nr:riboflavin transporter 2-like [Physella acuta]